MIIPIAHIKLYCNFGRPNYWLTNLKKNTINAWKRY